MLLSQSRELLFLGMPIVTRYRTGWEMRTTRNNDELTPLQRVRDEGIVDTLRSRFIAPLLDDLEKAVPGYGSMSADEKIAELRMLNAETGERGAYLLVSFVKDGLGTRVYDGNPEHSGAVQQNGTPGRSLAFVYADNDFLRKLEEFGQRPNGAEELTSIPIPYRIGMVAEALRQNVLVSLASACRFAAGIDAEPELLRYDVHRNMSSEGNVFSWTITIRDTWPTDELAKHIAREIRGIVSKVDEERPELPVGGFTVHHIDAAGESHEETVSGILFHQDSSGALHVLPGGFNEGTPSITEPSEENRTKALKKALEPRRKPSERPQLLDHFLLVDLPERNMSIGRRGGGTLLTNSAAFELFELRRPGNDWGDDLDHYRITWKTAHRIFEKLYPGMGGTPDSFAEQGRVILNDAEKKEGWKPLWHV